MPITDRNVPTMPRPQTSASRLSLRLNSALIIVDRPRDDEYRLMSLSLTVEATTISTPITPEVAIIMSTTLLVPVA